MFTLCITDIKWNSMVDFFDIQTRKDILTTNKKGKPWIPTDVFTEKNGSINYLLLARNTTTNAITHTKTQKQKSTKFTKMETLENYYETIKQRATQCYWYQNGGYDEVIEKLKRHKKESIKWVSLWKQMVDRFELNKTLIVKDRPDNNNTKTNTNKINKNKINIKNNKKRKLETETETEKETEKEDKHQPPNKKKK
eukprot:6402_1